MTEYIAVLLMLKRRRISLSSSIFGSDIPQSNSKLIDLKVWPYVFF